MYRYFVSKSSEFCRHNTLCCFSTSVYCCKRTFRYRLSPETFEYILVYETDETAHAKKTCVNQDTPHVFNFVCLKEMIVTISGALRIQNKTVASKISYLSF
jgi:hypothetical protein